MLTLLKELVLVLPYSTFDFKREEVMKDGSMEDDVIWVSYRVVSEIGVDVGVNFE